MTSQPEQRHARRSNNSQQVLSELERLHTSLQAGDAFPSYRQLMKQLEASERSVVWALEEMERQGKIVRRLGRGGAVVADKKSALHGYLGQHGNVEQQTPSAVAAASRTVVAVAIPDRALFDQAMEVLVEQAKLEELSILCHLLPKSLDEMPVLPQMAHQPLGFIIFRRELLPLAEKLHAAGHRVVLLATPYADSAPAVPVVYGDHEYGGYLATRHLLDLGHRRIAFCAYSDMQQTLRWQGHQRALREATRRGLKVQGHAIDLDEAKNWNRSGLGEALFRGPDAPTALAVWNDHEAAVVMGQLNGLGVKVPQDVSIVGYDNLREGQLLHPTLTTVHSSIEQQVQAALNLLIRPVAPSAPYQLVIQPTLVPSNSSAPIVSQREGADGEGTTGALEGAPSSDFPALASSLKSGEG